MKRRYANDRALHQNDNAYAALIRRQQWQQDLGLTEADIDHPALIGYLQAVEEFGEIDLWEAISFGEYLYTPDIEEATEHIGMSCADYFALYAAERGRIYGC